MRQAIVDMDWRAQQWTNRVNAHLNVSPDLLQGLMAYAYKQADIQRGFAAGYAKKWVPILKHHDMDCSFASKYDTSGEHGVKGKQKANSLPYMIDRPESEWESEDDNLN